MVKYRQELIDEIVDTTIDFLDEEMIEYISEFQPELLGKGEKVYYNLMKEVSKEITDRIKRYQLKLILKDKEKEI